MALFRNFGVNRAEGGQVGGIACAAYRSMPPRNSLISLNLQKIAYFWIGNYQCPFLNRGWARTNGFCVPIFGRFCVFGHFQAQFDFMPILHSANWVPKLIF
jgi:hypothetical protein